MFQLAQFGPLEQRLVNRDRLADLTFFAIEIPEDHVHLERVGIESSSLGQFVDREVDLVGDEEVETEQIMGGFPRAAPVEQFSIAQLVPLPGLANGESDE